MSELQSPNVWQYKPWWCQPWSIILTGGGIIVGSWLLLHQVWVTCLVSVPIALWWIYFLIVWPNLVSRSGVLLNLSAQDQFEDQQKE